MMQTMMTRTAFAALLVSPLVLAIASPARTAPQEPTGASVLAPDALTKTSVGGLEQTKATTTVVPVTGQPFSQALRVVIGTNSAETNATQLTLPVATPVQKGDTLLATLYMRGKTADQSAGQVALLFEGSTSPWTKSLSQSVTAPKNGQGWRRVVFPFTAAESYQPGEAMVSIRFAFGPQTVEVGGLSVVSYGKGVTAERLVALAAERNPLGTAHVAVNRTVRKQTLSGFGGNFCQPRYGSIEPMDAVGRYNLAHLQVAQARVGIPLQAWTPEKDVYKDDAQARASLLEMQLLAKRNIPIIGTVWEGPQWMLGGQPEQAGRVLPPEKYADCIEAIAQYLVTARDKYGVNVAYFSFNEPDYGVNFKFTAPEMANFIAQAGPRFRAQGLKTRFLTGDTTGGAPAVEYARTLLEDKRITPYLGPIAFHCWDALEAADSRYTGIAVLGQQYKKPVWCMEAGHDAQLWQKPNPWAGWENALRTAMAYEKTLRLTGASIMDYWTYQDNYPLVSQDGRTPYPVFTVVQQMEEALPKGSTVVATTTDSEGLQAMATVGAKPGQFSLLLINAQGAGNVVLSGLPAGKTVTIVGSTAAAQRTSLQKSARVDANGRLTVALPSRSVVTVMGK